MRKLVDAADPLIQEEWTKGNKKQAAQDLTALLNTSNHLLAGNPDFMTNLIALRIGSLTIQTAKKCPGIEKEENVKEALTNLKELATLAPGIAWQTQMFPATISALDQGDTNGLFKLCGFTLFNQKVPDWTCKLFANQNALQRAWKKLSAQQLQNKENSDPAYFSKSLERESLLSFAPLTVKIYQYCFPSLILDQEEATQLRRDANSLLGHSEAKGPHGPTMLAKEKGKQNPKS